MNFKLKVAGLFVALSGVVALTSAISTENVPLEIGNQAPEFSTVNLNGESVSLSDLKGQDVIVNFWSVTDAESRIRNVRLENEAERLGARYIGLCVDADRQLAHEVIKADRLSDKNQCLVNEMIADEYLAQGLLTVKIDPYGIVAEID